MIILLLFLLSITVFSSPCEDFIDNLNQTLRPEDQSALSLEQSFFLEYSAANSSDFGLGNKEACDAEPSMKYLVALRVSYQTLGFKTGVNHGICLPIVCTTSDVASNQTLMRSFYEIMNWKINEGETLEFYDPETPIGSKTFLFYFTIILFCLCILGSIGARVYIMVRNYQEHKKPNPKSHVNFKDIHDHHDINHDQHSSPHNLSHTTAHDTHDQSHLSEIHEKGPHWLISAFDIKENFQLLVRTAKEAHSDEHVEVLDFLMISTVFYCIYANIFGPYSLLVLDQQSYRDFFSTVLSKIMVSSEIITEYFFVMDGFMAAWRFFPQIVKGKFGLNLFIKIMKQKMFVTWPLAMMSFLFYWQLTPHFFSGPLGFTWKWEIESCNRYWWTKALFIDNLTNYYTIRNAGGYCMPLLWYTVAESQMFLAAVFVFAFYAKFRKWGYLLFLFLYVQGFGLAVAAFYQYDLTYQYPTSPTLYEVKYKWMPWKRWETYFLGALFGILYYEYNNLNMKNMFTSFEKSRILCYVTMIIGTLLTAFLIFFLITRDTLPRIWNSELEHMWYGIRIMLAGLSTIFVFMPMVSHRSFILKKIFSARIFQILAKISGTLFVYHSGINIGLMYSRTKDVPVFKHSDIVIHSFIVFGICGAIAFLFYLTIEKPWNRVVAKLLEEKHRYLPIPRDKEQHSLPPLVIPKDLSQLPTKSGTISTTGTSEIDLKKILPELNSPIHIHETP